ncbi:MAG: hypothetical protein WC011_02860 [Candidatus Paceibacterota bacterium]
MEEKNKNIWMIGGIVLVVIAVIVFMSTQKNDADDVLENENNIVQEEVVVEENVAGELDTTPDKDVATSPAVSLSYEQALIKYKDARLQLDKTCQASPDKMTFKNGTSIMLDNRAPVSRTVKVGSTYTIKAYGFKIIKLSASKLPVTYLVDCDKSQNVSTILLQS